MVAIHGDPWMIPPKIDKQLLVADQRTMASENNMWICDLKDVKNDCFQTCFNSLHPTSTIDSPKLSKFNQVKAVFVPNITPPHPTHSPWIGTTTCADGGQRDHRETPPGTGYVAQTRHDSAPWQWTRWDMLGLEISVAWPWRNIELVKSTGKINYRLTMFDYKIYQL